jgi:NAD(P)H-dependent FMN reductase
MSVLEPAADGGHIGSGETRPRSTGGGSPDTAMWPAPLTPAAAGRYSLPPLSPAAAFRQRITAPLLDLLPAPGDPPLSTTVLTARLVPAPADRERVWACLDRLARGGLVQRTPGRSTLWTRTRLADLLLHALPGPGAAAATTSDLAALLGLGSGQVDAALTALAVCGIAHRTPATRLRPGGPRWRRRPATEPVQPVWQPIRVVTLLGSNQPSSLTAQLAQAALDALTTTGIVTLTHHDRFHLGPPGRTTPSTLAPARPAPGPAEAIAGADLLITATPSYHGSVSGRLKHFLEELAPDAIRDLVAIAIAVETGGSRYDSAAGDLTALLEGRGARLPGPALVTFGFAPAARVADEWAAAHAASISHALTAHRPRPSTDYCRCRRPPGPGHAGRRDVGSQPMIAFSPPVTCRPPRSRTDRRSRHHRHEPGTTGNRSGQPGIPAATPTPRK